MLRKISRKLPALLSEVMYLYPSAALGREWEIHTAIGTNRTKLLPYAGATPASDTKRYSFSNPHSYLGGDLCFKVSERSRFHIGYQIALIETGMRFTPDGKNSAAAETYDASLLHCIFGGYSFRKTALRERIQVGGFAKIGVARGNMIGTVERFHENGQVGITGQIETTKITGEEVMPDYWTPVSSLGLFIGPVSARHAISNRLLLTVAGTLAWKNPYISPSKTEYRMVTPDGFEEGVVAYHGLPLQIQIGIVYTLFKFGQPY